MKIDVAVLRSAIEKCLDHVERFAGSEVEIGEADLYWNVPAEFLYDPVHNPKELTLGSLEDDWSKLRVVAGDQEEPMAYVLVWAAAVMRIVGERAYGNED